jgi:histidine triad (HIT) family protein
VNDCIFCKIVQGEIKASVVHDDEEVLAFHDVNGRAPVHVLVIPKRHVSSMAEVDGLPESVVKRLFEVCHRVAKELGVDESGYALRLNNGPDAGQEIFHLHFHVMGGKRIEMP